MGVTGKTKVVGLFGWPVEHSLSPAMHNADFSALEMDYIYLPFAVPPAELAQAVQGIRALGLAGVNITIPHKITVMHYLDEIHASARKIGAVNTIANREGQLIGYNTDGDGFIRSLIEQHTIVRDKQVIILGAGGAARAVIAGLVDAGSMTITVVARTGQKAQELTASFPENAVIGLDWADMAVADRLAKCDMLVNATPLGMTPHVDQMPSLDWNLLNPQAVVCDLVYNPLITKFLSQAQQRGHKIVTGEGMLAGQGALAFMLWTGQQAPYDIMLDTIKKQLYN